MGLFSVSPDKKRLRTEMAYRKHAISDKEAVFRADQLFMSLEKWELYQNAHTLLLYYSLPDELPTHSFLQKAYQSKKILLPAVVDNELELRIYEGPDSLQTGTYHISEPIGNYFTDYTEIDLCLIPGIAFDSYGTRLGRGKGYYDRLLPKLQASKVGICYDCQVLERLPAETHDIRMDYLYTETMFLQFNSFKKKEPDFK